MLFLEQHSASTYEFFLFSFFILISSLRPPPHFVRKKGGSRRYELWVTCKLVQSTLLVLYMRAYGGRV